MKALMPGKGEPNTVDLGLTVAMEGVNMAIGTLLADPQEQHRYAEVMRLATIGKALERQRARARKRVADFVPPEAIGNAARGGQAWDDNENLGGQAHGPLGRRFNLGGVNYGGCAPGGRGGELGDVEDLGDEPVNAPGDREPGEGLDPNVGYGGAIHNQGPMGRIGAPYLAGGAGLGVDDPGLAGMVAGLGGAFQGMAAARTEEGISGRRLDRAKEIDALSKAIERTEDPDAKARLQALMDAATASLEEQTAPKADPTSEPPPPPTEADPLMEPPPRPRWEGPPIVMGPGPGQPAPAPAEPRRLIACTREGCGNRHAEHWTTDAGEPLNCDVCNSPMDFIEVQPLPAAAAGNLAAPRP